MRGKYIIGLFFFMLVLSTAQMQGKDMLHISLSLRNVVDLAISQSSSVKYVQNQ